MEEEKESINMLNNNRIIKFRAWDKEEKMYRYLDFDDAMISEFRIDGCLEFRGQFTGLLDKEGVEIYEGDIVKYEYGQIFEIKWDYGLLSHLENIWFKIIGNIYENPELLGDKK